MARAANQVVGRVLVFYVLAIFLIVCIVPWNETKRGDSPSIAILDRIGPPASADIAPARQAEARAGVRGTQPSRT